MTGGHSDGNSAAVRTATRDYLAIGVRALFMVLFLALYGIAQSVVGTVILVQLGFAVFTGHPQPRLARFGGQLARYVDQTIRYWTFNSDEKPFPFSDWPSARA